MIDGRRTVVLCGLEAGAARRFSTRIGHAAQVRECRHSADLSALAHRDRSSIVLYDGASDSGWASTVGLLLALVAELPAIRVSAQQTTPVSPATNDSGWVNVAAYAQAARAPVVQVAALNPGTSVRRDLCLTLQMSAAAASQCGDLRLVHPLPSVRTMNETRTPVLLYNSQLAHPRPILVANVTLSDSTLPPDTVLAILSMNGVVRDTGRWRGTDFPAGATRQIAVTYDALADSAKVNGYTLTVTGIYNSPPSRHPAPAASGTLLLVNRAGSPFGAGWWLAGLEQLYFPPGDSTILWVGGDGSATLYHKNASPSNTWTGPSVDRPDTLKWDGTNYVRYLRHGLQVKFNSAGQHVATVTRVQHVTTFTYAGALLTGIQVPAPAGGATLRYAFAYSANRLQTVTSPGPRGTSRVTMLYSSGAKVDSILDPDLTETTGYRVRFGYGSDTTRIVSRTNKRGFTTYFGYDGTGRLAQDSLALRNQASIVVRYRNADSLALAATPTALPPDSAYVQVNGPRRDTTVAWFVLDRFGAVAHVTNALGATTLLTRSDARWPAAITRVQYPNGRVMLAAYNARGTEDSVVDSATVVSGVAARTKYKWDARWDYVDTLIAPAGEMTSMAYDTVGNRQWQQVGPSATRRVTFTYDPGTLLLRTVTEPLLAAPDSVSYDASLGDLTYTTTPLHAVLHTYVDGVGRDTLVKTQIDSAGQRWLWQHYTYDDADRTLTATTAGPRTNLWFGNQQIEPWVDSTTLTVTNAYDSAGNVLSVTRQTAPDSNRIGTVTTSWVYDEANRQVKEIAPDGIADSMAYDPAGNAVSWTTRRGGAPVLTSYDALNRRATRIVPAATYAETTMYNGGMFQWTFPDFSTTGLTIPADTATYAYNVMGELVGAVNRDAIVRRTYNANGTLRTDSLRIRTYAELGAGGDTTTHRYGLTYGYDLDGRRAWLHVDSVLAPRVSGVVKDTIRYGYDATTGLLATVTDPLGATWRYAYDAALRVDTLTYPGGIAVQSYDGAGRAALRLDVLAVRTDMLNDDSLLYDVRDHVVFARTAYDSVRYHYTALGAVALAQRGNFDGTFREDQQWNPDGLGNLFQALSDLNTTNSLHTYRYDAHTGRLRLTWGPNLGGASYFDTSSYDPAGNRHTQAKYDYLSGTYSFSSAPKAVETQMNYYAADQALRVLDRTECYLPMLNLLNCDPPSATPGAVAGAYEEYRYDALGRRILVRTRRDHWCQNTLGCVSTIARTVWDGAQVLFEIRQRGDSAASVPALENDTAFADAPYGPYGRVLYTHGAGLDHPLGIIRLGYSFGDGATTWAGPQDLVVHTDWRGVANAGHWTDGTMSAHCSALHPVLCVSIRYPGPSTLTFELPASAQPDTGWFGSLLTQQQDASGQLYKRNRYYDPSQGRFTQEDPAGLAGGLNAYGYANGDPVNLSDPFGLCPYGVAAESAYGEGRNTIIVCADGSEDVRSGGTRTWRNSNPGNIRPGKLSRGHGEIGAAGGFEVYPDVPTGADALDALLKTHVYQAMTVDEMIAAYAPASDNNNTAAYQATVRRTLGVTGDTKLSGLTAVQLKKLEATIRRVEGWQEGTVTSRRPR